MEKHTIDLLFEKYLQAETSLEEEALLKKYVQNQSDLPEEYQYLKSLFGFYEDQRSQAVPLFKNPATKKKSTRVISFSRISVAASILLLIGYFVFLMPKSQNAFPEDTYSDPTLAAQTAVEALEIFADQLNRGSAITKEQVKEFEIINKYMHIFN